MARRVRPVPQGFVYLGYHFEPHLEPCFRNPWRNRLRWSCRYGGADRATTYQNSKAACRKWAKWKKADEEQEVLRKRLRRQELARLRKVRA